MNLWFLSTSDESRTGCIQRMGMLVFPSQLWWSGAGTSAYFTNYSKAYIGRPEQSHVPTMNGLSNFAGMKISRGHLEQLLCGFAASVLLNFVSAGEAWRSRHGREFSNTQNSNNNQYNTNVHNCKHRISLIY